MVCVVDYIFGHLRVKQLIQGHWNSNWWSKSFAVRYFLYLFLLGLFPMLPIHLYCECTCLPSFTDALGASDKCLFVCGFHHQIISTAICFHQELSFVLHDIFCCSSVACTHNLYSLCRIPFWSRNEHIQITMAGHSCCQLASSLSKFLRCYHHVPQL